MVQVEKQVRETPQVGIKPYQQVHAHSTGNKRSTAQNEANYMARKNLEEGFYSHVVGNGRIIQVSNTNQGAWDVGGGYNYETYASVELIESHSERWEFERDYTIYVNFLRELADEAGIPKTLDDDNLAGIKTHHYCTYNQPNNHSDHVDPYPYLASWGIHATQFKNDVENGIPSRWLHADGGWWYLESDGTYPTNCWKKINGVWYRFDANGYMLASK